MLPTTPEPGTTVVPYNGEGKVKLCWSPPSQPPMMTEGCGLANEDQARIVGGSEVPAHRYPWMVGMSFNSQWFCGGRWVLPNSHKVLINN